MKLSDGEIIVARVNTDHIYTSEETENIYKAISKQIGDAPVIFVPKDIDFTVKSKSEIISELQTIIDKLLEGNLPMKKLISFELNNWFCGRDYPNIEPFKSWVETFIFDDDDWCAANKLVVLSGCIDMSRNWCITATKEWIEKSCPELLSNIEYTYKTVTHSRDGDNFVEHSNRMSSFIRHPDEDGSVEGRFGWAFPEYCEENFGVHWYEDDDDE